MSGGNPLASQPVYRRAITWRSLLVGLLISLLVVTLTPFNDYVVNNSFMIGAYFPPVVSLSMLAIVLVINGPLHRFAPRLALSPGELAIVIAMALISCAIPSQGLMRMVLPSMVSPFHFTGTDDTFAKLFKSMQFPDWLFAVESQDTGHLEQSYKAFYSRLAPGDPVPWSLWIKPVIGWGIFAAFMTMGMVATACLIRFQWAVNERLAFPIAQLQNMLISPPQAGRSFNDIFASKIFWIAAFLVIIVQGSFALHTYFPAGVPAISYKYDMKPMLTELPWSLLPDWIKAATIYFTLLGLSYFTQTRVSFSLWGIALLVAVAVRWPVALAGSNSLSDAAMGDQQLGAAFAFLAGILWIGRHHWVTIGRAVIGRSKEGDARGAFLSYRVAAIMLLVAIAGMMGWFMVIGCSWWMALLIVAMTMMAHLLTARLVAETGLAYVRVPVNFDILLTNFPATSFRPKDAFVYGLGHFNFMQAARESSLAFTLQGLQTVADVEPAISEKEKRRTVPVLFATFFVAAIACVIASLWFYYHNALPMDDAASGMLNQYGLNLWPKSWFVDFPKRVADGAFVVKAHNSWMHIAIGLGVMLILQALTWRFNWWPFMPVGYLLCTYFYVTGAAFSIFLGWLAKTLILRFGGAKLFNDLKPFFIGLIFGEALSMGLWLIVTMVLAAMGEQFKVILFMPQ